MLRRALRSAVILAGLLFAQAASAATLYITEYQNGVTQIGSTQTQAIPQVAQTSQTVALSGTSAPSAAFGTKTNIVSLICDEGCSIQFASTGTPLATTSTTLLQQGVTYNFGVAPGWKVAGIANAAGDTGGGGGTATNVNLEQVGGVATAVGNGTTNAGTQRVTISSDSTGTVIATQATAANLNAQVVGNVASGAADSGPPVKTGATYNTTLPTLTNGQRGDMQLDSRGNLRTSTALVLATPADGQANLNSMGLALNSGNAVGIYQGIYPFLFNGTSWDRWAGNTAGAFAQGNVAAGAADAGNPVKVGGTFNTSPPTLTTGQRGDLQLSSKSGLLSTQLDSNGNYAGIFVPDNADGVTALATSGEPRVSVRNFVLNPAGAWDRTRAGPYQLSQTPLIAGSGNVANAAAAATLTGTASTTVYLAGFEMTASGATAGLPVTCTVTGLLGGTRSYTFIYATGALLASTPLEEEFNPALPASAINTAIVVSCPASGVGGTNATMVAHGFYQ